MTFDLSHVDTSKAADEGRAMVLHNHYVHADHPEYGTEIMHEDTPVTITLIGSDGNKFQQLYQKRMHKMRERSRNRQKERELSEAEKVDLAYALYADLTLAWEGIIEGGQPLECTHDNVRSIYKRFPWIFEQVVEFVGDREAFLPNKS